MARYCTHCGNEVHEEAVICVKCGCALNDAYHANDVTETSNVLVGHDVLINTITQRIQINGIIWLVIAIVQILLGILINWVVLIVGVLNLISSIQDLNYSKSFPSNPVGLVQKVKPLTGAIITLIYNLLIGGVIGVIGSIYYLVAVRGYVLENEVAFLQIENSAR